MCCTGDGAVAHNLGRLLVNQRSMKKSIRTVMRSSFHLRVCGSAFGLRIILLLCHLATKSFTGPAHLQSSCIHRSWKVWLDSHNPEVKLMQWTLLPKNMTFSLLHFIWKAILVFPLTRCCWWIEGRCFCFSQVVSCFGSNKLDTLNDNWEMEAEEKIVFLKWSSTPKHITASHRVGLYLLLGTENCLMS